MTKIKLCGLCRPEDVEAVNELKPDYIGFVFAPKSRRYISPEAAEILKQILDPAIAAVGVFVDEKPENVAALLERGVIDLAQLHGAEDAAYLHGLRALTDKPIIQAFRVRTGADVRAAGESAADYILLDAGAGEGRTFDWSLLSPMKRDYFLAGGLGPENAGGAVAALRPYAIDVSSGIETDGVKDAAKMRRFVEAVRKLT